MNLLPASVPSLKKQKTKSRRVSIKSTRASSLSNLDPISQSVGKNVASAFFLSKKAHFLLHKRIPQAIDCTNILFKPMIKTNIPVLV